MNFFFHNVMINTHTIDERLAVQRTLTEHLSNIERTSRTFCEQ